jgi:hypothetical protein
LILVNEGSSDESWEVIVRLVNEHHFITGETCGEMSAG